MQYYDETARLLGITGSSPADFAHYLAALARAQGEDVEVDAAGGHARVRQKGWRLVRDLPPLEPAAFEAWCELWRGALAAHDRRLALEVTGGPGAASAGIEFVIS